MLLLLLLLLPLCRWKCLRHATKKKLKLKDWKFDCVILSRDWNIQELEEAVTSEKSDHVLFKLTLIAKINFEKQKMLRQSQ